MERTEHVLLIGSGAERFALAEGFTPVDPRSLVHPREYEGYEAWVKAGKPDARIFFDEEGKGGQRRPARRPRQARHRGRGDRRAERRPPRPLLGHQHRRHPRQARGPRGRRAPGGLRPLRRQRGRGRVLARGWGEAFIRTAAAKSVADLVGRGAAPPGRGGRGARHHPPAHRRPAAASSPSAPTAAPAPPSPPRTWPTPAPPAGPWSSPEA